MITIPHATEAIRMKAFQTHTAAQPISIQPLHTQKKPCVTEAWHNAEKHSLLQTFCLPMWYVSSDDHQVSLAGVGMARGVGGYPRSHGIPIPPPVIHLVAATSILLEYFLVFTFILNIACT